MTNKIFIPTIITLTVFIASLAFSQARRGSRGWGAQTEYNRMYNPKTVETISGQVLSKEKVTPMKGMSAGIHIMLKTEKESISVHLGPSWYIENQDTTIQVKDQIQVKGSRVTLGGKVAIIAAEVMKGDQQLKLRDENGFPVWSGWRRRQ